MYHPSGGTIHRGHFDRAYSSPPTGHTNTCTPVRTCTPASHQPHIAHGAHPSHFLCGHSDQLYHSNESRYKMQEKHSSKTIESENTPHTPLLSSRSMDTDCSSTPATPKTKCRKSKNPNKLMGVSPSDIDKYSRVIFPVCFICFNLMYWVIYLHISNEPTGDLIAFKND